MKYVLSFIFMVLLFSCQSKPNNTAEINEDSVTIIKQPALLAPVNDSAALPLSKEILSAIKNKNYNKLVTYIQDSIRFSPYGYIDTMHDKKISASLLLSYLDSNLKINWGVYDGSDDAILLTAAEYFKKFVYDVDFVNAPQISLNKTISKGNSLNNIIDVYKHAVYTEFYFSGFDKKYDWMDWRSLKLVFKKYGHRLFLIAIIHDQWTI